MPEISPLWIPIIAILMPVLLVPNILILKHRALRKEWEHKERMKAMELGLSPDLARARGGVAAAAAGVPIAAVIGAVITTLSISPPAGEEVAAMGVVWICSLMISTFGMITSLFLAHIQNRARKNAEPSTYFDHNGKPAFDPDAFDVVSNRG